MTLRELIEALLPGRWDAGATARATEEEVEGVYSAICRQERREEAAAASGRPYFSPQPGYFSRRPDVSDRDALWEEEQARRTRARDAANHAAWAKANRALEADIRAALQQGEAVAVGLNEERLREEPIPSAIWGAAVLDEWQRGERVRFGERHTWLKVRYFLAPPPMAVDDVSPPILAVSENRAALEARCAAELRAACEASPGKATETAAAFAARWKGLGVKRETLRSIRADVLRDFPAWSTPGRKAQG